MIRKTATKRIDALTAAAFAANDAKHALVSKMAADDSASLDACVKATYALHIIRNELIDELANEHISTPRPKKRETDDA